jgi:spermidine synthase
VATLVTALMFLSGLTTLVYGVVWVRALGPVVGDSLWATAGIVALIVSGVAVGRALVTRWLGRIRHHLRWTAFAQTLAAVAALSSAPALELVGAMTARLGPEPLAGLGLPLMGRLLAAEAFLLLPAAAMGATLPLLMCRVGGDRLLDRVSRLYTAQAAGAVVGVLLTGYLGLPALGGRGTLSAAAVLGLLTAAVALCIERRAAVVPFQRVGGGEPRAGWACLLYPAIFGLVTTTAVTLWARIFLLPFGGRVYAVVDALAICLLGLAIGGTLSRLARSEARRALARWQVALAFALVSEIPLLWHFAGILGWLTATIRPVGFAGVQVTGILAVTIVLLPAGIAMGVSFPLAVSVCTVGSPDEGRVGTAAAAHAVGGTCGVAAGPFVLVPVLGTQVSLLILVVCSAVVAWVLATQRVVRRLAVSVVGLALVFLFAIPPRAIVDGLSTKTEGAVETMREDASGTVVVRRVESGHGIWRSLELNGATLADSSPALRATRQLQTEVSMLLVERPERVLDIGFGTGVTAWAAARRRAGSVTVVEPSPGLLRVSDAAFGQINHGVLHDPGVKVWLNDGRNALLTTSERFDVILSDAAHPVVAGSSAFYTREYFELCRRHLRPGGVVSMWLPMYSLSVASYATIVRAFWEVFPNACIWYDPLALSASTVVTGSTEPGPIRVRWRAIDDSHDTVTAAEDGVRRADDLAAMLLLGPGNVAYLVDGEPPHVDDFPTVEYRSGRLLDRERSWLENFRALYAARARACPVADFPGDWNAVVAARDRLVAAQLRALGARVAAR